MFSEKCNDFTSLLGFGFVIPALWAPFNKKAVGVSCVIAKSFARIFYRNAINIGLPVLICDTDKINDGDQLEVDLEKGIINNLTNKAQLSFSRIPEVMLRILGEGGLIPYIKKYKSLDILSQ